MQITVFGNSMLDRDVVGTLKKVTSEGDIETLQMSRVSESPSGAAPLATRLTHLWAETILVTALDLVNSYLNQSMAAASVMTAK